MTAARWPVAPAAFILLALSSTRLAGAAGERADAVTDKGPLPLQPAQVLRPATGFFDEAMALDPSGHRVALVRTDGATFAKLEIFQVATGQALSSWDLATDYNVDSIHLLPEGQGVLLVARRPGAEELFAIYLDGAGRPGGKTGPATAFAMAELNDAEKKSILIAMEKKVAAGGARAGSTGPVTYSIAAFRPEKLEPVGKPRSYRVAAGGELLSANLKMVDFFDGFSRLLGERAGGYDRKTDFRRPSRQVVLDTLSGKIVAESEIGDVYGWALTTRLRAQGPNRTVFSQLNQDGSGLEMIAPGGQKTPLALAVPFRLYDHDALHDEEGQGPERGIYYFSLPIDPLNPDAVARKKADRPYLDLYAADVARASCVLRGRIALSRPVSWRTAGGEWAVLKKFKSFTRGGDELELYHLR